MTSGSVQNAGAMNTEDRGLKKHNLSTFTVVFMIFSLVAAGCYGIEDMIPEAGPGLTLVILVVLPFVWGLPFGLVASELGSVRPQEGGYYKWVQEALGEFWGFQAGWWRTISIYIDNTLYVVLAGGYLGGMFNLGPVPTFLFKALMILIFMGVNIRGVRDVGIITNILSIFVIVAFAMITIIGITNWGGNPFTPFTAGPAESGADWFMYIGGGIAIGMWSYSGYESMSTIAGELKDPQVISRATLITVPLITATYILPTMAALSAFRSEGASFGFDMWGSEAGQVGYASLADHFLGPAFGILFGIVAIAAQCSIYNTYIASGSRGFFALSDDNLAPNFLVKVDKKRGVPYIAVISVAVVNLILCQFNFPALVVVDVFLLISSYIMVYISAMILRRRIPKNEYKFRIPGGNGVLGVICIVPIIIAVFSFLINGSDYFIGGMVGIISGPIVYFIFKRYKGGLAKKDPVAYPLNQKTKLAVGDVNRMAVMFGILAVIGAMGCLFLPWYEADWVGISTSDPDYAAAFAESYYMTLFGTQQAMWNGIRIATGVAGGLAVLFALIGRMVEPRKTTRKE